jgi:DMSO reductase anchor subunit
VTAFVFGIGAIIFYSALYKYKLIPRWISGFGIIAILLHIISGVLVLFGLQENFDTSSFIMNLPIAVQEMVMAVWLIIKGFNCENKPEEEQKNDNK